MHAFTWNSKHIVFLIQIKIDYYKDCYKIHIIND